MNHIVNVLRFGWTYLRRYWVRLLWGLVCGGVFALSNGSFIWATRTLTVRFSPESAVPASAPVAHGVGGSHLKALERNLQTNLDPWLPRTGRAIDWRQVVGVLLFLPLLVSVRSVADYLSNYCMGWVGERVIRDVRLDIMEKLSALSLDFFTRSNTGDLLTRINVDTTNLLRALRQGAPDLVKESTTVVVVLAGLFLLDWKLTLLTMVVLPACMLPLMVLGKKARRAMSATLKENVSQSSQLVELLGGIRVVKAYTLETEQMNRFRQSSSRLVHAGMKGIQAKQLVNPVIEVVSMLGLGLLLLYVFASGRSGADLVGFITGVLLFFLPIKKLAGVHILFEQASVGTRRILELLGEQSKVIEPAQPKSLPEFRSEIVFDHVSFAYDRTPVLRDFSLNLPRGTRLGVAGESGSGKTTFVNLLFRFYDPTGGAIRIDGLDLREVRLRDLRALLALVSQDVVIFDQTVAENIGCGRPGATAEEIEQAARAAFLHDFIQQLPEGYATRVGERGVTLSGGQRQRLSIARAFVRDAPILVLDEATAQLDPKAEAEVQTAIDRLAQQRTVICVAHRLSTLAAMDQIIVLADGGLAETGRFEELLRRNGLFASMAAKQGLFPQAQAQPERV